VSCVQSFEPQPVPPCRIGIQAPVHDIFDKLEILRNTLIYGFDILGKLWQCVSAPSQNNCVRNDHLVRKHVIGHCWVSSYWLPERSWRKNTQTGVFCSSHRRPHPHHTVPKEVRKPNIPNDFDILYDCDTGSIFEQPSYCSPVPRGHHVCV
jgi:hypothetical protein